MEALAAMLQRSRLLHEISRKTITEILIPRGSLNEYPASSTLYFPQDTVSHVQLLLSGRVNLIYYMADGNQDLRNTLLPPDIIGLDLICTRTQVSPYQAVAAEKSAVFSFPAGLLMEAGTLPEEERQVCINQLLILLSHMNMQKEYKLAILTHRSMRDRILIYLTMQANRRQAKSFSIPFSREELASFLNVNRSALSHELSLLKQEGVIDFHKNRFTLLDRE